ncbi:AA_permease_C domain-containing protein, partial [Haematococcus lacustris]
MQWAKYVVCIGAVLGIFTTVFMALLGAARILTGCSRERMLPPIFAWVSKSRQTPYVATITIGLIGGGIALFSEFAELSDMISIGTLLVFFFVAVGLLWFRCNVRGKTSFKSQCLLLLHTVAIVGFAM